MKRFALLCVSAVSLAATSGCCWHHSPYWGGGGGGYGGACQPQPACGCGYGAGYNSYPGMFGPGAYYSGTTMQAMGTPIYAPMTAGLNPLPTY